MKLGSSRSSRAGTEEEESYVLTVLQLLCCQGSFGSFYNSSCPVRVVIEMQDGGGMLFFALDGNFLQVCATSLMPLTKISDCHFYSVCSSWFTAPTESAKLLCIHVFSDRSQ